MISMISQNEYTACFTGHRPQRFRFKYNEDHSDCIKIKKQLEQIIDLLIDKDVTNFISGMALGVDTWCAEIILDKKKENKQIKLIAAIPCKGQDAMWSQRAKIRYNNILSQSDSVVYLAEKYTTNCMQERNKYMVDNSDIIIAVYDNKKSGGTYHTLEYAKKKELGIIIINPDTMVVHGLNY